MRIDDIEIAGIVLMHIKAVIKKLYINENISFISTLINKSI